MRRYKGKMNVALIATGKTLWRHSRLSVLVGVGVLVEVPTAELQVPHSRAPPRDPHSRSACQRRQRRHRRHRRYC